MPLLRKLKQLLEGNFTDSSMNKTPRANTNGSGRTHLQILDEMKNKSSVGIKEQLQSLIKSLNHINENSEAEKISEALLKLENEVINPLRIELDATKKLISELEDQLEKEK